MKTEICAQRLKRPNGYEYPPIGGIIEDANANKTRNSVIKAPFEINFWICSEWSEMSDEDRD